MTRRYIQEIDRWVLGHTKTHHFQWWRSMFDGEVPRTPRGPRPDSKQLVQKRDQRPLHYHTPTRRPRGDGSTAAPGRTVQPKSAAGIRSRASLAVHVVNKAPKEHLDVREPSHLGNVGQHRPLVTPQ
jgi:hypothetical protein